MKKIALLALVLAFAGLASADVVDFTGDSTGFKANGFVSVGSPNVSFSDSNGSFFLEVNDFGVQSHGNGLVNRGDDTGYLIMNFTGVYSSLSLEFGDDDPNWITTSSQVVLTLYLGGNQVGQIFMNNNADDIMNQTISSTGIAFDQATFMQIGPFINGQTGLSEVVDNVTFGDQVPEPGSLVLLGSGLIGLAGAIRRKLVG